MTNTNYTTTDNVNLKKAYSDDLNNYLQETRSDWIATPASITNQVFIRPKNDKEWYSFKNGGRIGVVNDENAGQLIYMTANHEFRNCEEYTRLIEQGWKDNNRKPKDSFLFGLEKKFSDFSDLGSLINSIESVVRNKT
jgi:hypothetical protein